MLRYHVAPTIMSYDNEEEIELSEKEKQEVFQDLLSGSEYVHLIFDINISASLFT